ncbi:MAG TPA: hypothetical protein VF884_05350, partial [Nitrososphaeraceae archaeon]
MSPPFGLFKKKESSKKGNRSETEQSPDGITLNEASNIIEKVISHETKSLIDNLEPVKRSVENILDNLS